MELSESPDQGPPVPAKDPQYQTHSRRNSSRVLGGSMDIDRPSTSSTAPPSGSKRKRADHGDNIYDFRNGLLETYDDINDGDERGQTPNKRPRSNVIQSDGEFDDLSDGEATPANQRNLRRKKGSRNLSNLNLRHAASTARLPPPQLSPRESKFQEGSLNDKPSQQPPSVFTRPPRTDSGNLEYVDELMANYHDGIPTPAKMSLDANLLRPQDVTSATASQKENDGMYRFGQSKSWYSNFHPVVLWNSLFKETKEELTRQNMLEAERKGRLKAEAEAKYAQMKHTGQLGLQPVTMGNGNTGVSTPRDSGIAFDNTASEHHHRATSYGSQLRTSNEDTSRDASEASEPPRTLRGRLSRLALRKPSMSSLTGTMKRTKSDFNLAASNRDASFSGSPVKTESDTSVSILNRSTSKYDLRRQHRLSKKVSDLESKLQKARSELEGALAEATPAPKLGNRYERWTPVSSLRRQPKFVPGALPTLPSERLLFTDPADINADDATIRIVQSSRPRQPIDLDKAFDNIDDDDDTVRPARGSSHTHAKDIFERSTKQAGSGAALETRQLENKDRERPQTVGDLLDVEAASSQTVVKFASSTVLELPKQPASDVLDAKLKAIDASVKASKKPVKVKKRQSVDDDSGTFRPRKDEEADDDAEWEEAQQGSAKKKRKSTGKTENSPQTKSKRDSGAAQQQNSPASKLSKTITSTTKNSQAKDGKRMEQTVESHISEDVDMEDAIGSEDELAGRPSIEDENASLEPLYEVEEEVMPLKEEPAEPTAIATPARHGQGTPRSRSVSPYKRTGSVQPAAEERMLTRAADAAQASRPSRSPSPPAASGHSKQVSVNSNVVKITPGLGDIPNLPPDLPKGINISIPSKGENKPPQKKSHRKRSHASKENFEWPEDVF